MWTFVVSAQRCPCFFTYFQENLSYNVLLITMWIAYNVTRLWNRFLVTDVTSRQYGKLLRHCKKCKLPMAAHRKEGVFARSTNDTIISTPHFVLCAVVFTFSTTHYFLHVINRWSCDLQSNHWHTHGGGGGGWGGSTPPHPKRQ